MIWDRVFYYPCEPVVWANQDFRNVVSPGGRRLIQKAVDISTLELHRLQEQSRPQPLHGNLDMWNVMNNHGRLTIFDFEDVMLGSPVQDVAITLHYGRERADYRNLRAAFRMGYESVRPWPVEYDGQLERLMAARTVMLLNHALRTSADPSGFVARATAQLAALLPDES